MANTVPVLAFAEKIAQVKVMFLANSAEVPIVGEKEPAAPPITRTTG
jgi:hypothetical protein